MKIKNLLIFAIIATLFTGCATREVPPKTEVSNPESSSASVPSTSQSTELPASDSTPAPESEPQELYDGGQEDPTIIGFPKARWEHIEYKNFGGPDSWETFELKASQYENGAEIGDPLVFTFKLPTRVSIDGTFDYDGDFAQGNIKIGDGFSSFAPLPPGETAANNTNEDYSIEHFRGHPLSDEIYTMTETTENIAGSYCYGSRGDISFARYIVGGASPDNTMLQYVVQLGDRYLTSAYFYVSENATADDLKIYDEIVLSVKVKE